MKYTLPPGVFDILPNAKDSWRSSHLWNYVENTIKKICTTYGYQEIRTPIFEKTDLFTRSAGEISDIVTKEMYTFHDRGDRSLTLRPEGTAPAIRAFIENHMENHPSGQKLFYIGPMFRYERQQAGRYRQHHQFGAEAIGSTSPEQDVELIDMAYTIYTRLGLQNLSIELNSIGTPETRNEYRTSLQQFLKDHINSLSDDSQRRFYINPLRILDSKDPTDKKLVANAPSILEFLDAESTDHFEQVKYLLNKLKIPFRLNHNLVRGLDYYNRTVFEITANELGAHNSIGGGGRYDGLLQTLNGPNLPATGFATGIERIIQTLVGQNVNVPSPDSPSIFLIALGEEAKQFSFSLLHQLRAHNISSTMDFTNRKLAKIMQTANLMEAKNVCVIGSEELQSQIFPVKNMKTGETHPFSLDALISTLSQEH